LALSRFGLRGDFEQKPLHETGCRAGTNCIIGGPRRLGDREMRCGRGTGSIAVPEL